MRLTAAAHTSRNIEMSYCGIYTQLRNSTKEEVPSIAGG